VTFTCGMSAAEPPTVVVLTVARDEGVMLRRWVAHYAAHVGVENLIVLDDSSVDGSTTGLPCTVHRLPGLPGDRDFEVARMDLVSGMARGLLAVYDVVVFVDVDEFLIPDPDKYADLREFLAARPNHDVIAPMALNVVHHQALEGALDPDRPVLGQRQFAKFVPLMCKPAIKRVPAPWRFASHGITAPFQVDPELFMVHLKFADRDLLRTVADHRRRLVDADRRGVGSSWAVGGDELTSMLATFVDGPDADDVPEFAPTQHELDRAVHRDSSGAYRAAKPGQLKAMELQPLVRVPQRLFGRV
jgi:hypothetical protein